MLMDPMDLESMYEDATHANKRKHNDYVMDVAAESVKRFKPFDVPVDEKCAISMDECSRRISETVAMLLVDYSYRSALLQHYTTSHDAMGPFISMPSTRFIMNDRQAHVPTLSDLMWAIWYMTTDPCGASSEGGCSQTGSPPNFSVFIGLAVDAGSASVSEAVWVKNMRSGEVMFRPRSPDTTFWLHGVRVNPRSLRDLQRMSCVVDENLVFRMAACLEQMRGRSVLDALLRVDGA